MTYYRKELFIASNAGVTEASNFTAKDQICSLIMKFPFHKPFSVLYIPQAFALVATEGILRK